MLGATMSDGSPLREPIHSPWNPGSGSRDRPSFRVEPEAHSAHGQEIKRGCGMFFQLHAEPAYVCIEGPRGRSALDLPKAGR